MSRNPGVPSDPKRMDQQVPRALSLIITAAALIVAIVHAVWPDVTIDAITLGLLGIAILPWLGHVLADVELPGGFKLRYRDELRKLQDEVHTQVARIDENQGAAQSAITQASVAVSMARGVQVPEPAAAAAAAAAPDIRCRNLIEQYDKIREQYKSGNQRTALMTDVVGEMIALAPQVPAFDIGPSLSSKGGQRLAAYAQLYASPDPAHLDALVRSLGEREPGLRRSFQAQPFEQYWGILALRKVLGRMGLRNVPDSVRDQLEQLLNELRPGIDRHYELSRILQTLNTP